jgi:hypothetical protein
MCSCMLSRTIETHDFIKRIVPHTPEGSRFALFQQAQQPPKITRTDHRPYFYLQNTQRVDILFYKKNRPKVGRFL